MRGERRAKREKKAKETQRETKTNLGEVKETKAWVNAQWEVLGSIGEKFWSRQKISGWTVHPPRSLHYFSTWGGLDESSFANRSVFLTEHQLRLLADAFPVCRRANERSGVLFEERKHNLTLLLVYWHWLAQVSNAAFPLIKVPATKICNCKLLMEWYNSANQDHCN